MSELRKLKDLSLSDLEEASKSIDRRCFTKCYWQEKTKKFESIYNLEYYDARALAILSYTAKSTFEDLRYRINNKIKDVEIMDLRIKQGKDDE